MQARPPRLPQRWCLPRSYRPWASKDSSTYSPTSSLAPPSTRIAWKGGRCTSATFPTVTRSTRKVLIWRLTSEHTRVRNLTSVRGKAARGSLPAQTNWHGITASTRDKSHLSAICAKDSSQEATICPCTWKDTRKITKWVNLDKTTETIHSCWNRNQHSALPGCVAHDRFRFLLNTLPPSRFVTLPRVSPSFLLLFLSETTPTAVLSCDLLKIYTILLLEI